MWRVLYKRNTNPWFFNKKIYSQFRAEILLKFHWSLFKILVNSPMKVSDFSSTNCQFVFFSRGFLCWSIFVFLDLIFVFFFLLYLLPALSNLKSSLIPTHWFNLLTLSVRNKNEIHYADTVPDTAVVGHLKNFV